MMPSGNKRLSRPASRVTVSLGLASWALRTGWARDVWTA
jgi:hypothetical protein